VGGGEVLLLENLLFAQLVAAQGGDVQVDVWESMWHDFIEHSEGCGSGSPLVEAHEALQVVGDFLRGGAIAGGCRATGGGAARAGTVGGGFGTGAHACVRWHAQFNILPRVLKDQCKA
jgi:hypothetical protein